MKINLRPYAHDHTRWHVDIRLMHPTTQKEIRKRLVAPAGLSEAQARAWGERQVPALLLGGGRGADPDAAREREEEVVAAPTKAKAKATKTKTKTKSKTKTKTKPRAPATITSPPSHLRLVEWSASAMTLRELYEERFDPEYVQLQKPATQVGYETVFRNHIAPALGDLPLAAIDVAQLSAFRAGLRRTMKASTCNLILAKVAKMLRYARQMRIIEVVPEVERFTVPRARPKAVLSAEQITALVAAARAIDTASEVIVLLALDAGLRSAEICALEWADIDLKEGSILVQNNTFRGIKVTPKGTIGKLALTSALREALERHRRSEPIGPLVLYRQSKNTAGKWEPQTPNTIRHYLRVAQRRAGLPISGPHLLRHTSLTRLANLGASVHVIQAVARHSWLQTTQAYLHTQQVGLAREAAELLDRAAGKAPGKSLAKRAKSRQRAPRRA
ncbi:MAG: tyrosine-type recombinase/integrase [Myxococcales bacterium]|nr:tyrosine-type recombinase/integrase [Myxococcales bacterium]